MTTCDEAALKAALESGGTVKLACDGIIPVTSKLMITKDVVLDGTGRTVTLDGRGVVRVLQVQPQVRFTLRNLTITRGHADQGGGLLNNGGVVVLMDSVFSSSQAVGNVTNILNADGGAVYSNAGELVATNCLFTANSAVRGLVTTPTGGLGLGASGGAIAIRDGVLSLVKCQFQNNQASGGIGPGPEVVFGRVKGILGRASLCVR